MDHIFDSVLYPGVPNAKASVPVNVSESDTAFELSAELPGYSDKDVSIKVEDRLLTVSATREKESEEKEKNYLIKERKSEHYERSFVLPDNADRDNIKASMKNGVLNLVIAKVPQAAPKQITITPE
jgi:HSP20 family protein